MLNEKSAVTDGRYSAPNVVFTQALKSLSQTHSVYILQ